ncbi:MAG: HYR domain-containing protein, partial [Chitinophagaceae bacterium]|nr:HYR domain-containing protein [Chitinophagaceae bacterium]
GLPAGGDLGCNPTPPTCSQNVTASNECGPVDVRCSAGDIKVDGCKREQTFTYTATACDLTETKTVTYTWKEDKEGPVITIADITAGECNTVRFEAQVSDDCGKVVSVEYSHPSGTVFPVGVTTVTVTAKDECGNVSTKTFTVTIIAKPTVTLTAPEQPYCGRPGNKLTATATGSGITYSWTVSGNGWIITDGANSATITYTSGIGPATFTVTVTDQYGCKATAELTLDCTPLGCSPGFWKNHKELWDNEGDYVPQRMPAGLRFTINTPLHVYFGIPNGSCGLMKDLTMGQAVGANGGGCNAFVRHAVSALLSSASFGPGVLYPSGTSDFTSLYNAIKFALSTCNCKGTLFSDLEKISESDHAFCSDLGKQIITLNQPGGSFSTGLSVKAFPNPYEEKVVFTINSKESGRATLEVYNMMGQKIATVFDGQVKGGTIMNITYNVPVFHRENLVYIFRQNGKSESGKVLSLQY